MASEAKHTNVAALDAERLLPRGPSDLKAALYDKKITGVTDVVGGTIWPALIDLLAHGGGYDCSGAIAEPKADLDLRNFCLHDFSFAGLTVIDHAVMPRVVGYIETGEVKPVLVATYALSNLHDAQLAFIAKSYTENILVCP